MKRFLFIFVVCSILVVSCKNSVEEFGLEHGYYEISSEFSRSSDEAIDVAVNGLKSLLEAETRTDSYRQNVSSVSVWRGFSNTETRSLTDNQGFYVVNFEDNGGYALVPIDRRATDIYAISTEGNLNLDLIDQNTSSYSFYSRVDEYLQYEIENYTENGPVDPSSLPITPVPDDEFDKLMEVVINGTVYKLRTQTANVTYEHLTPTTWHQDYPYNMNLAGHKVGCATVAIVQIMAYNNYPLGTKNKLPINWSQVLQTSTIPSNPPSYYDNVLKLIYEVYLDLGTINVGGLSIVDLNNVRPVLSAYGYGSDYVRPYFNTFIANSLEASNLVCVFGSYSETAVGHAWVIDGYRDRSITNEYYYLSGSLAFVNTNVRRYVHCNWGDQSTANVWALNEVFEFDSQLYDDLEIITNIQVSSISLPQLPLNPIDL